MKEPFSGRQYHHVGSGTLCWKTADGIHCLGLSDALESNLLIYWNWMYLGCYQPNHFPFGSFFFFSRRLFTDAPLVVLKRPTYYTCKGCAVISIYKLQVPRLTKGNNEVELDLKKNNTLNALAFWILIVLVSGQAHQKSHVFSEWDHTGTKWLWR